MPIFNQPHRTMKHVKRQVIIKICWNVASLCVIMCPKIPGLEASKLVGRKSKILHVSTCFFAFNKVPFINGALLEILAWQVAWSVQHVSWPKDCQEIWSLPARPPRALTMKVSPRGSTNDGFLPRKLAKKGHLSRFYLHKQMMTYDDIWWHMHIHIQESYKHVVEYAHIHVFVYICKC